MDELDRLLRGISTYQDVVIAGRTVRAGRRDCAGRWALIEPHLPASGLLLDVGANFGWFALRWCSRGPERLAIAWEGDLRSAAVARHVLHSHEFRNIALCTALAEAAQVRRLARSGVRIDAALCLSVLHWIADHKQFLCELGGICDRILIEQPDPRESGAGDKTIRDQIGEIGPYLQRLFPDRPAQCIARLPSHRETEYPRELWLVGPGNEPQAPGPPAVDVGALVDLDVAWPPRDWWIAHLAELGVAGRFPLAWTPAGLKVGGDAAAAQTLAAWRRTLQAIPRQGISTAARRLRRLVQAARRRFR